MRKEVRIVGVDDGPFDKFKDKSVLIVGTIFRGGQWLDGVLSTRATVDGVDGTQKILQMIKKSKFFPQLRAIFLNGIAVGGFNVIDLKSLSKKLGLPVIAVTRDYPDFQKIYRALEKLRMHKKIKLIEQLPKPTKIGEVYVQYLGCSLEEVRELMKLTCTRADIPEPLRVAHIIAAGVVKGESKGKA